MFTFSGLCLMAGFLLEKGQQLRQASGMEHGETTQTMVISLLRSGLKCLLSTH